jgi:hypothetical protein
MIWGAHVRQCYQRLLFANTHDVDQLVRTTRRKRGLVNPGNVQATV